MRKASAVLVFALGATIGSERPFAQAEASCAGLPTYADLKAAMITASGPTSGITGPNRGFNNEMWGTIVNRDGVVCAVVFTGPDRHAEWPGSRVISAQKANTANAFNLDHLAISTANLYPLVQPGASLFGLQESNPVATDVAYKGPASNYGMPSDPMVGDRIGGVNVFGGGLGLFKNGKVIGGLGVSGDTSCADHNIAWKARKLLGLNATPNSDNIAYGPGAHPFCVGGETPPAP
jgi:uncharacterized protein GlcG (DUF336 family)